MNTTAEQVDAVEVETEAAEVAEDVAQAAEVMDTAEDRERRGRRTAARMAYDAYHEDIEGAPAFDELDDDEAARWVRAFGVVGDAIIESVKRQYELVPKRPGLMSPAMEQIPPELRGLAAGNPEMAKALQMTMAMARSMGLVPGG